MVLWGSMEVLHYLHILMAPANMCSVGHGNETDSYVGIIFKKRLTAFGSAAKQSLLVF
jgi:hypothetical protein